MTRKLLIAFLEGRKGTQTTNLIGFHQDSIAMEPPYQVIFNVFFTQRNCRQEV